jgi:hypothetical protein
MYLFSLEITCFILLSLSSSIQFTNQTDLWGSKTKIKNGKTWPFLILILITHGPYGSSKTKNFSQFYFCLLFSFSRHMGKKNQKSKTAASSAAAFENLINKFKNLLHFSTVYDIESLSFH